jgi:hypothetical protein
LQLVSEVGLIGAGNLFLIFIYFVIKAIACLKSASFSLKKDIAVGGSVAILGLMFLSLAERNLQIPANSLIFIFVWVLTLRMPNSLPYRNIG